MKEIKLGTIGKLIITENLEKIIDSLHGLIGSTEWSGILFYKLKTGDIKKMKDLVFEANFLYPMDIGSSTYTEFQYNEEITNAYDQYEDAINCQSGICHSHHTMPSNFSGTDNKELEDNAKHFNYFISLIVNFRKSYSVKIAFPAKTIVNYSYNSTMKDENGKNFVKTFKTSKEEEVLFIGELEVILPENTKTYQRWIIDRVKDLENKKRERTNYYSNNSYNYGTFEKTYGYNDFEDCRASRNKSIVSGFKTKSSSFGHDDIDQFLSSLIFLDISRKNTTVYSAFAQHRNMSEADEEVYDYMLETNLEIIHENLFGKNRDIVKDCEEAVKLLESKYTIYKDVPIYVSLIDILDEYASTKV